MYLFQDSALRRQAPCATREEFKAAPENERFAGAPDEAPLRLPGRDLFEGKQSDPGQAETPRSRVAAVACSLALHMLLAWLCLNLGAEATPPGLATGSQTLSISLVDLPAAGSAAAPVVKTPPVPAPKPRTLKKPAVVRAPLQRKATLSLAPAPKPLAAALAPSDTPSVVPAPASAVVSVASVPAGVPAGGGDSSGSGGTVPSAADVHASVPLYDLNPPPAYPMAARRRNLEGTVWLKVLVDEAGQAAQVKVMRGSGHALLDRSALDSVLRWRFAPGRRGGLAQAMWVQVPVRFRLQ